MVDIKSSVFSFSSHTWLILYVYLATYFYFNILSIGFQFQGVFFFFFWVIVGLMGVIGVSKSGWQL